MPQGQESMQDRIRVFIAIPLPREVIDRACELQARLRDAGLGMRWVRPAAIHLTLKFLGDIDRTRIAGIDDAIAATAGAVGPLNLAAKGLGVFPGVRKARVLWMGIAGQTPLLVEAHRHLEAQMAPLGFPPEKRRFSAHLTLARAKGRLDPHWLVRQLETVGGFEAVPFVAREIVLFRSELRPDGAVYTRLVSKPLA